MSTHRSGTTAGLTQFCPRYHQASELVGRRWSGAIIRVLISEPRRFHELIAAIPGLSDRMLTERLKELEGAGVVARIVENGAPVRVTYALTKSGKELEASVRSLSRWAERWIPAPEPRRKAR